MIPRAGSTVGLHRFAWCYEVTIAGRDIAAIAGGQGDEQVVDQLVRELLGQCAGLDARLHAAMPVGDGCHRPDWLVILGSTVHAASSEDAQLFIRDQTGGTGQGWADLDPRHVQLHVLDLGPLTRYH